MRNDPLNILSKEEKSGGNGQDKKRKDPLGILKKKDQTSSSASSEPVKPSGKSLPKTKLSETEEADFQEWRKSLPKNLQKDSDDYDLRGAFKAGLEPDESGHLPSRDPKTGLLLKSPDHPTWDKLLEGEKAAGYKVHFDEKTNRYYSKSELQAALEKPIEKPKEPIGPQPDQPQEEPQIEQPEFVTKKKELDEFKTNLDKKKAEIQAIKPEDIQGSQVRTDEFNQMISDYSWMVDEYNKDVKAYNELIPKEPDLIKELKDQQLQVRPDNTVGQNTLPVLQSQLEQNKELATQDKIKAVETLKQLDNGISGFSHALSVFDKTVVGGVALTSKAIGVVSKQLSDNLGPLFSGPEAQTPLKEYITYQWGAKLEEWAEETFPTNPKYQRNFLANTLPSGAGSIVAMVLGGAGRKIVTTGLLKEAEKNVYKKAVNQLTGSMARGSFMVGGNMMGVPEYENAKAAGLSDQEAFEVFLLNYMIGQTDAMAVGVTLNRINKATGGWATRILNEGWKGGSREMFQEISQNYLTNLTAQKYYDEFRKLYEGMAEEGAAGFILGALLGSAGAVANGRPDLTKEQKQKVNDYIKLKNALIQQQQQIENDIKVEEANKQLIDESLKEVTDTDPNDIEKIEEVADKIDKGFQDTKSPDTDQTTTEETKIEEEAEEIVPDQVEEVETKVEEEAETKEETKPEPEPEQTYQVKGVDYTAKNEEGNLRIFDKEGNEVEPFKQDKNGKTVRNSLYETISQKYAESYDFAQGQEATHDDPGANPNPFMHVAETSNNPGEVAMMYEESGELADLGGDVAFGDEIQTFIHNNWTSKIKKEGYLKEADPNTVFFGLSRSYFAQKGDSEGRNIDQVAQELSYQFNPDGDGTDITVQDLVDYMDSNPNRTKQGNLTAEQQALKDRFVTLTGLPLNHKNMKMAVDQYMKSFGVDMDSDENVVYYDDPEAELANEIYEQWRKEATDNPGKAVGPNQSFQLGQEESNKGGGTNPPTTSKNIGKAQEGKKKKRAFPKQVLKDPNISEEVKKGLKEDTLNYVPLKNIVTNAEANAIIELKGLEESIKLVKDKSNGMHGAVRTALAENLIRRFNQDKDFAKAIDMVDFVSQYLTEAGQTTQAAAMFSKLTPEGQLRYIVKEIKKRQSKENQRTRPVREKAKADLDKINEETIEKVLKDKKLSSKLSETVKKKSIDKAIDFLESLKIDTKGKALDASYGLTAALWNTAVTTIQKSLKAGYTISQAINRAVKKIKESKDGKAFQEKEFRDGMNDQLKTYKSVLDPDKAIKEGLKDQGTPIYEVVKKHYTEIEDTKKDLVERLVDEANLDKAEAEVLAKEIGEKFDELARKAKETVLKRYIPKPKLNQAKAKIVKQLHEDIIQASNLGVLDDATFREMYSEKLGTPSLTEEQAAKIVELAEKAQMAPEGFQKRRANQDLVKYVNSLKNITWTDVGMALWYANILSGPSTQILNFSANLLEVMGETWVSTIRRPRQIGFILKGLFSGYGKGMFEAIDVWEKGYDPDKGLSKLEIPAVLDQKTFWGGKYNPFNYLKYVKRMMDAADIFSFTGLKEMRSYELIKLAEKRGDISKKEAKALLGLDEQVMREAVAQAHAEGLKGRDIKRRTYEIIAQSRPEWVMEDAKDYAAKGTFNYDPEGTMGLLSKLVANMTDRFDIGGVKPMKFIIPFTRIISNVANRYLDWTPHGLIRVAKGGVGFSNQSTRHDYTPDERARVLIKALSGTAAMVAMYALTDDEDGIFEITANGTGNLYKNFELQESGWRPYSIKIGDTWYNYQNTPLAIPFSVLGFIRDAQKYDKDKVDMEKLVTIATFGTIQYMMDLTFLRGISDFFDTFGEGESGEAKLKKATKLVERVGKSFVIPNAFTQLARTYQEIKGEGMKKAAGFGDELMRDIPVLRDSLGNLYNSLGEPVIADQVRKFKLFKQKRQANQPVWNVIAKNQAWIGRPGRNTVKVKDGMPMSDEEYEQFALRAGKLTKEKLEKSLSKLQKADTQDARDMIRKLKNEARREANEKLFGEADPLKGFNLDLDF